jgi:hypothetical protein
LRVSLGWLLPVQRPGLTLDARLHCDLHTRLFLALLLLLLLLDVEQGSF